MSENTVAKLMREQGLAARPKRGASPPPGPAGAGGRAPDLVKRQFPAARLNHKWYGDGTEIPTDEGKLHLVSVMEAASRRVLGFTLSEHHNAAAAYGALAMAVTMRARQVPGVIMHTDQGSEYTARAFQAACQRVGIAQSMGRPAVGAGQRGHRIVALHPGVRSCAEWSTSPPGTRLALRWRPGSEDYNTQRRHTACQKMPPAAYEQLLAAREEAA